jgi:multisubunit Na+/H+ antiporter MnhC subunit
MTVTLVSVLFVAAGLVGLGAFIVAWKRELTASLTGLPVMFAGAGTALVGVARFGAATGAPLLGQEMAVLLGVAALSAVGLGIGLAGREGSR